MAMIVGSDYAYVECNSSGCRKQTEKTYGSDAQNKAGKAAEKLGWHKSFLTGSWFCPDHK